jgi:hypothetical protein
MRKDEEYREEQRAADRCWREQHPEYYREYRRRLRERARLDEREGSRAARGTRGGAAGVQGEEGQCGSGEPALRTTAGAGVQAGRYVLEQVGGASGRRIEVILTRVEGRRSARKDGLDIRGQRRLWEQEVLG